MSSAHPLNLIIHFWLHHTAHCAEKIVFPCWISKKGGDRGRWVGSGAVHRAVARFDCKRAMVGTEWANSHPANSSLKCRVY